MAPRELSGRRAEHGFTLIEVMIAVLLTAIAVVGVVGLHTAESRSGRYARHVTEATELASGKMEALRATLGTSLASGSETGLDALGAAGGIYTRSWTVAGAGPYTYNVTVGWSEDGTAKTVVLYSERNK